MSTDDEEDSDDWLDAQVGKTDRALVRAGEVKSSRGRHWQSESGGRKGGLGDRQSDRVRESGGRQSKSADSPAGESEGRQRGQGDQQNHRTRESGGGQGKPAGGPAGPGRAPPASDSRGGQSVT
eukprot:2236359-Rhodomonas_salina.1